MAARMRSANERISAQRRIETTLSLKTSLQIVAIITAMVSGSSGN